MNRIETRYYSPKQIADMWGVTPHTVVKLIRQQKLQALVIGRIYRISQEQLDEYYKANTIQMKDTTQ